MAERPVLRGHATFIREGIVCGNAAVGLQPDDLAQILAHVLRRVELLPLARGDEEILAVGRKGEAVREMTAPRHLRVLLPEDCQPLHLPPRTIPHLRLSPHGPPPFPP